MRIGKWRVVTDGWKCRTIQQLEQVMRENTGGKPVMAQDWANLSQSTTLSHFATVEKGSLVHRDDPNP